MKSRLYHSAEIISSTSLDYDHSVGFHDVRPFNKSKNEISNANIVCKINNKQIINMCGKTTVKSLFRLINSSQYHISHDDGTMHVASVYSIPGMVIFGLTAPKGKWFPLNKKQRIFYPKKNINEIKPIKVFKKIFNDLNKLK